MKRGGGIAIAAAFAGFLLSGISSPIQTVRQGSETETATSTASDLFIPTSDRNGNGDLDRNGSAFARQFSNADRNGNGEPNRDGSAVAFAK